MNAALYRPRDAEHPQKHLSVIFLLNWLVEPTIRALLAKTRYYILMRRNIMCGVLASALSVGGAASLAQQKNPATIAARDSHEGLLVAADPWIDAVSYRAQFKKKSPYDAGIAAIDVFFRNENDKPIQVDLDAIRLLLEPRETERQKLVAISPDQVADQVLNPGGAKDPSTSRSRIPLPGRGVKKPHDKKWEEFASVLRAASLQSEVIAPKNTVHGLLYFDLDGHFDLLRSSRLYIPELKFIGSDKNIFYFEIDLSPHRP